MDLRLLSSVTAFCAASGLSQKLGFKTCLSRRASSAFLAGKSKPVPDFFNPGPKVCNLCF